MARINKEKKSETDKKKQDPKPQNVQKPKQLTSKKEHPINQEITQVDTSGKMGPSSSSHMRLIGKYVEAEPKEKEYLSLLQNKLPLTKVK